MIKTLDDMVRDAYGVKDLMLDIQAQIATLEAHEPVEPIIMYDGIIDWYECGKCGQLIDRSDNYCRKCGRMVRWG